MANITYGHIQLDDERDFLSYRDGSGNTVEIFDIVVGTDRGRGRGRRLVSLLLDEIDPNTRLVFAIARSSNRIAKDFYTALGFRTVAVLERFYNDDLGIEDAIMYGKDL